MSLCYHGNRINLTFWGIIHGLPSKHEVARMEITYAQNDAEKVTEAYFVIKCKYIN